MDTQKEFNVDFVNTNHVGPTDVKQESTEQSDKPSQLKDKYEEQRPTITETYRQDEMNIVEDERDSSMNYAELLDVDIKKDYEDGNIKTEGCGNSENGGDETKKLGEFSPQLTQSNIHSPNQPSEEITMALQKEEMNIGESQESDCESAVSETYDLRKHLKRKLEDAPSSTAHNSDLPILSEESIPETLLLLAIYMKLRKRKVKRRLWVKERNLSAEVKLTDKESYRSLLRMDVKTFEVLVECLTPYIKKKDTNFRKSLPVGDKLAITLRYLATGESHISLASQFGMGQTTVSKLIPEVCEAIVKVLEQEIRTPKTNEQWAKVEKKFLDKWNFPHCVGAIDGKHILIFPPPNAGSHVRNSSFSVILLGIVDADLKFIYTDVGSNGWMRDGIWDRCAIDDFVDAAAFHLPHRRNLPNSNLKCPSVFVANSAFPFLRYIMKPYPGRNLEKEKVIFNYRLSRASRVAENAFGVLAARFQVFKTPIRTTAEKARKIIRAACLLNNYLRSSVSDHIFSPPEMEDQEDVVAETFTKGEWRNYENGLVEIDMKKANNYASDVKDIRDTFCQYVNTDGKVPWQDRMAALLGHT